MANASFEQPKDSKAKNVKHRDTVGFYLSILIVLHNLYNMSLKMSEWSCLLGKDVKAALGAIPRAQVGPWISCSNFRFRNVKEVPSKIIQER